MTVAVDVRASAHWYDLSVELRAAGNATAVAMYRRFMGRMETGETTTSDPAMAAGVPGAAAARAGLAGTRSIVHPASHPVVDAAIRTLKRITPVYRGAHKDASMYYRRTEL